MIAKQGQELIVEGFHTTNTNFSLFSEVQHPQTEERMMKINKTSGCAGGKSKVKCGEEQYGIGTRNVRSMNQGKLDVVKQEITRVNINILGINELK